MPFEICETVAGKLKEVKASISYTRYPIREGRRRRKPESEYLPRLVIGIPKAAVTAAKKAASQAYVLQIGAGADAGKARLLPCDKGQVRPRELKGGLAFRFGYVPLLGNAIADREYVDVKALPGGGFEIALPAWFRAD
jgi:hypothetical protein